MPKKNDHDPLSKAHNKALRLLGIRNRSRKEVKDRLQAYGYSDEITHQVIVRLEDTGLVDDRKFAFERARSMGKGKGWGPRKLRWDLARYGVSSELTDLAVEQAYGRQPRTKIMCRLVRKRYGEEVLGVETDRKTRAKALRFLLGRGFEPDEVHGIFKSI
ncbi:MAG: regulatory protein RecX [Deltaproteobacteria bacterium]|nr:regulatory protein RecX [Deltaproteobacteria bacterium]